jgi:hypothetical protein
MNHYDSTDFERKLADAQTRMSSALPTLTIRDEANALIAGTVRNNPFFEKLHAGEPHPALEDPAVSRISDTEMKRLMVGFSAMLALLLDLRDRDPAEYARQIAFFSNYSRDWERKGTGREGAPDSQPSA